jgi:hypothetical protein
MEKVYDGYGWRGYVETKSMTLRMQASMLRYSNWANLPTSGMSCD